MKLKYDRPAERWTQGLPIGNGHLGAVVYGGGERETWALTEVTYWSGKSERTLSQSEGRADLERMRTYFYEGDYESGHRLVEQLLQPERGNFGTHMPMCDIRLSFDQAGTERFVRELDLEEAVVNTEHRASDGTLYEREIFASHPDGVIAARLASDSPGGLSFTLELRGRTEMFAADASGNELRFQGTATETMHSDGTCGTACRGVIRVIARGGAVRADQARLIVENCDEVCIYTAAATDYERGDSEWISEPARKVELAARKGYARLKADHLADYRNLYARVAVDFGASEAESLPLDRRIDLLREGGDDPQLYALFYQYGRYLMIAGSREDSRLPMHLQGIWNDGEACRMPWSCDYHLDVNIQMNYYPVEAANLAECHQPLLKFVERLAQAGRSSAHDFYGCRGWVAHVFTNAWGFTAPGGHYSYGMNVTGGLWLAAQLQQHYAFSKDDAYLKELAYPVLKSAAQFFLDYMAVHPASGYLMTGPSNSPENSFYVDGRTQQFHLSMGTVMDTMLVRELFAFCIEAARKLDTDAAFLSKLEEALPMLPPLSVGKGGQLQEWLEDYGEAQPDHRHLSHLYGFYPGNEITLSGTPELADAVRVTLENRQRESDLEDVEFTLALFAAGHARLREGDHALKHLTYLIGELCFDNLLTFSKPGIAGAEAYIFIADGNFGGATAIGEMLLQSHAGEIDLLPALPANWKSGKFEGLRTRGNVEVDAAWDNGRLVSAAVKAYSDGSARVRYGHRTISLAMKAGEVYKLDSQLQII